MFSTIQISNKRKSEIPSTVLFLDYTLKGLSKYNTLPSTDFFESRNNAPNHLRVKSKVSFRVQFSVKIVSKSSTRKRFNSKTKTIASSSSIRYVSLLIQVRYCTVLFTAARLLPTYTHSGRILSSLRFLLAFHERVKTFGNNAVRIFRFRSETARRGLQKRVITSGTKILSMQIDSHGNEND